MSTATHEAPVETAEKSTLTPELFKQHMSAMKVHYQTGEAGPSHAYALPIGLLHPVNSAGVSQPAAVPTKTAKQQMDAALEAHKTATNLLVKKQQDFVSAQTSKLQQSHDTSSFAAALNAQKAKAKAESDANIDKVFNTLQGLGEKHPELQQHILSATQKIGAFLTSLLASVAGFFSDIYKKIVGWISSAIDWVKGAAATIANWASGAVNTVEHFFSSISSIF